MTSHSFFTRLTPSSNTMQRDKSDRRFSTMFMLPPASQTEVLTVFFENEKIKMEGKEQSKSQSSRQNLKGFLKRMLSSNTQEPPSKIHLKPSNRLWDDLFSSPTTSPARQAAARPQSQYIQTATQQPKPTRNNSGAVTVHPPTRPLPTSSKRTSMFSRSSKSKTPQNGTITPPSRRSDSKFNSITSLPSLSSLLPPSTSPHEHTTIPPTAQTQQHLLSLLRRLTRKLQQQEYLTHHLSTNLSSLLSRKERQITIQRRLRIDEKAVLENKVFRLREASGRAFLRKAVFAQRGGGVVAELCSLLSDAGGRAKFLLKEGIRDREEGEGNGEGEVRVDVDEKILCLLHTLLDDLSRQRELDKGLRNRLLGEAGEGRWNGSVNDRIMARRFCVFVEGRLAILEGCYGGIEGCVEGIEGCLRRDGEGRGV